MAQVINTNIASLNAQRQLNGSQSSLNTSLERLSSGLRINSARDDAAGLAISERFTAQINGLNQAVRNANDGISLAQTAESSLSEVTNNLQRIRELAVQSANATNSSSDRVALQEEVTQLVAEIDRVAGQANFNGVQLLNGNFQNQIFQVGANAGETINVESIIDATSSNLITATSFTGTGSAITGADVSDLTINGNAITAVTNGSGDISAVDLAAAIETADSAVTATVGQTQTVALSAVSITGTTGEESDDTLTVEINGVLATGTSTGSNLVSELQADIEAQALAGNFGANVVVSGTLAGGTFQLTDSSGANIAIENFTYNDDNGNGNSAATTIADQTVRGTISLSSSADIVVAGGDATAAGLNGFTATESAPSAVSSVLQVVDAEALIGAVDNALDTVNGARAELGAISNRFESVVTSLQTSAESLSAARSRILDADFAAETANLTKNQILQQAGIAILSQANALPQNVLALLG